MSWRSQSMNPEAKHSTTAKTFRSRLVEKARNTWNTAPAYLRYDIRADAEENDIYCSSFALLHTYLDYLYTIFLVQRTLVKRTNTGQAALFETSREVLSNIIRINAERDSLMDMTRHYSWIVRTLFAVCSWLRRLTWYRSSIMVFLGPAS